MKHTISHLAASALLTLAAALAGCADEPTATNAAERQELRLTATIEGAAVPKTAAQTAVKTAAQAITRADEELDNQIAKYRRFYTWVEDATTTESLYAGYMLEAEGDGTFRVYEPEQKKAATMYFPQSGNAVEISALGSNFFGTLDEWANPVNETLPEMYTRLNMPNGDIPFFIITRKMFEDHANEEFSEEEWEMFTESFYCFSDLLFARQQAVRTSSNVELQFYHMLSKIEVQLAFGTGLSKDDVASVTLDDALCAGTFSPTKGTDITSAADRIAMIAPTEGSEGPVRLWQNTADPTYFRYVVVPQQVAGKTLTITLKNGTDMVYTFPTGAELVSGSRHLFKVKLLLTGLTVTSTVEPWGTGTGDDDGVATYRKPAIGDYLLADGSWVAPAKATAEQLATVIGIVFQTDPARIGQAEKDALKAKGVDTPHGLAVATKAAGDNKEFLWFWHPTTVAGDRDETVIGIPNIWVDGDAVATFAKTDADIDGYAHNVAIRTQRAEEYNNGDYDYVNGYDTYQDYNKYSYPAFKVAETLATVVPPPSKSTGWYLPSVGQWYDILRGLCKISLTSEEADGFYSYSDGSYYLGDKGDVPALMNAAMANVPADRKTDYGNIHSSFWTSSSASSSESFIVGVGSNGYVNSYGGLKNTINSVRPILAF